MTTLHTMSLAALQKAYIHNDATPTQVVEACLQRIAATDGELNACITVDKDGALQQAEQLEKAGRNQDQPLWGIPITVKDNICTKGLRTTCASRMLENFIPPYDATVVQKLKAAGAIILAKTNLDAFGMGAGTQYSTAGATSNPWNQQLVAGGSSGGSAASVAAGQCFGSLGTDSGGSVRQPAAFCGLIGFKPTYGRVSRFGAVAYASSFDQVGTITRSVEDSAILYSSIAGHDSKDSTSAKRPVPTIDAVTARTNLSGVTIGIVREFWQQEGVSPEVTDACNVALDAAKSLGAQVQEVSLPHLKHAIAAYYILTCAEASTNLARFDGVRFGYRHPHAKDLLELYTLSRSEGFNEEVKRRILLGTYVLSAGYYDAYYQKAAKIRQLICADYQNALQKCDLLLAPTTPVTAWAKGAYTNNPIEAYKMDQLTIGLNLAGLPGLSIPAGLGVDSGMPVGVQLTGRSFAEAELLSYAHALSQSLPPLKLPLA